MLGAKLKESAARFPIAVILPSAPTNTSYEEILSNARVFISTLADSYDSSLWGQFQNGILPSSWAVQRGWAVRTGVGATIGMAFSISVALRRNFFSFVAFEVLVPLISIAVIQVCSISYYMPFRSYISYLFNIFSSAYFIQAHAWIDSPDFHDVLERMLSRFNSFNRRRCNYLRNA
jgi:hypothetical protein